MNKEKIMEGVKLILEGVSNQTIRNPNRAWQR